ncbi:MAG: hypothetical protein KC777_10850 [Cyanobacteria bacterium HKST-UBA02]|nr:hypothetical protein [Cyanobacteria bacterium HKST-UBA02]
MSFADIGDVTSFNPAAKWTEDGNKAVRDVSDVPDFDTGALFRDSNSFQDATSRAGIINRLQIPIATIDGNFERVQQDSGSFVDTSTGSRPGFDYILKSTGEGDLVLLDGDHELRFSDDPVLAESRKALLDLASKSIDDPQQLSKFTADMIRFENRAREANLTPEEVRKTYEATGRLLEDNPEAIVDSALRTVLAEQVMAQAAIPTGIDQGRHNTCNVTAVESIIYTTMPSRAANLVADVATTVSFTGSDGTRYDVPATNIGQDKESRMNPPPDGRRSFASQLFQVAAVNAVYQSRGEKYSYFQSAIPDPNKPGDTGERLFDLSEMPPRLIADNPYFFSQEISDAYRLISGQELGDRILDNSFDRFKDGNFSTPEELHALLTELSKNGGFPAILNVNTNFEPFRSDSGRGTAAGDEGGDHVVTITGYDPETRQLKIDNQWGSSRDHIDTPVPLEEAFLATLSPETGGLYRALRETERNYPNLTKAQTNFKALTEHVKSYPDSYLSFLEVIDSMANADRTWQQQRQVAKFDFNEHDKTTEFMNEAFDQLPPYRNMQLLTLRLLENGRFYPQGIAETAYQAEQSFYDGRFLSAAGKSGLTGEAIRNEMTRIASDPSALPQEGNETLFEAARIMSLLRPEEQDALLRRLSSDH